jgi:nitrate reductase (cytochrome), electron transfer subunit
MRRQNRTRLSLARWWSLGLTAVAAGSIALAAAYAQDIVPRLTGTADPMADIPAPPLASPIVDDQRRMRNYPEQPPIIPHSIEGYQITLNANRCLDCHRRQFTDLVRAPMISISHFVDRDGNMLADVAPRRYQCTACHVQQTDARPLVENEFRDMLTLMPVGDQ